LRQIKEGSTGSDRLEAEREKRVAFDGILQFGGETGIIRAMSKNSTIFIVDDDEAVRDSLKLLLESHGYRVEEYSSTREFIRGFRRQSRQCLVLDHHLPGETGLDFLESDDGASLRVPVILMSGGGDASLRARAAKAGALRYFDKPLDDSELVATIFRLLEAPV
jgi:two-component system response regulator FixJ